MGTRIFGLGATVIGLVTAFVTTPASAVPTYITAGTIYGYATSSSVAAAPGSLHFTDAANSDGGICVVNTAPCTGQVGPLHVGPLVTDPVTGLGVIEIQTPSLLNYVANYLLTIQITGTSTGTGDIYNVVVNGVSASNIASGANSTTTTTVVNSTNSTSASLSGTFSALVQGAVGGSVIEISVTDLLQQYLGGATGTTYDLPSKLGVSGLDGAKLASAFDPTSSFNLKATFVLDPEPASLSVFAIGSFALGFVRRRIRRNTLRH